MTRIVPVLAAGVGARHGSSWVLRAASFRMNWPAAGRPPVGIVTAQPGAGTAIIDLLAGLLRPSHGELRVLGEDLTTPAGRAAVRGLVGVARRSSRPLPCRRVRGVIARRARLACLPRRDRDVLTAAILDRLGLTAWADVPVRATPTAICRRAGLAAAAVHEPGLLLLDGLFDNLSARDAASLADCVCDLSRDTAIIATGRDAGALGRVCDEVLTLSNGILVAQ